MKKYLFKILSILSLILMFFSCQNLDLPELGDYPLDGPVITFISPNPTGATVLQTIEPTTSLTIKFDVTDDIAVKNIIIKYDNKEIANMSSFTDAKHVTVNNLVQKDIPNGNHTITIVATDSDGKVSTQTVSFIKKLAEPYVKKFNGEVFYMPFEGNFYDLVSATPASEVGTPGYSGGGAEGTPSSYVAGANSYLTFPTSGLSSNEFSGSFWYQVNGSPDRAGILVVGKNTDRFQGFRLFREGSGTKQRIKLNVGTGSGESWNDGGELNVGTGEWVHIAFTISSTQSKIYFNGELQNTSPLSAPIDWTGTSQMVIGSGGTTFSYWDHLSDSSKMDELRIFNKALSSFEVKKVAGTAYEPLYNGETFYMPFDGKYNDRVSDNLATVVGTPTFAGAGHLGSNAYKGAVDSYLNYPISGLFGTDSFSVTFWYKVNATPDRSGILVVGNPNVAEDRTKGFRIFREGSGTEQRIKLNVGTGSGESWNDGNVINVATGSWVHVAITVSPTESKIYFNGVLQNTSILSNHVDWSNCSTLNIGSGGPTFNYWGHLSDLSALDELRLYNKALTQAEIQSML